MNFIEAMNFVHQQPVGPKANDNVKARAVWRKGMPGIVFYDTTMFLGIQELGLRWTKDIASEAKHFSPTMEDLNATDWEEFVW